MDLISIGQRIKKQRELKGYTREELAELVDITPRFCYDLEQGLKGMSLDTLCRISQTLHISTDYLLFGSVEGSETYIQSLFNSCPKHKQPFLEQIMISFIHSCQLS